MSAILPSKGNRLGVTFLGLIPLDASLTYFM